MLKKQATKKAKKRESRRKTDELTEREKDRSKYVSAYEQMEHRWVQQKGGKKDKDRKWKATTRHMRTNRESC